MNYLQRANLDGLIAWREKYMRGYLEQDAWPPDARLVFNRWHELARREARRWLANESKGWRKGTIVVTTDSGVLIPFPRSTWKPLKTSSRKPK